MIFLNLLGCVQKKKNTKSAWRSLLPSKNDAEVLGTRLWVWRVGKMGIILLMLLSKNTGGVLLM